MRERVHPPGAVLLQWLDGELRETERAGVEAHLAGCPACRREAARIGEISGAVAACRDAVFEGGAPVGVRRRHARRAWRTGVYALGGAIAAAWMAFFLIPAEPPAPVAHTFAPRAAAPAPVAVAARQAPPARVRHRKPPNRMATAPPASFLALPFSGDTSPVEQAAIIRVDLPRSALQLAGVAVEPDRWGDRVTADVLLGMDGRALAIRFVE